MTALAAKPVTRARNSLPPHARRPARPLLEGPTMKTLSILFSLALFACGSKSSKTYEATTAGFDELAKDLVVAVKDDDESAFEAIVKAFELPNAKIWFETTFGPEAGARLLAEYDASPMKDWKRGYPELRKLVVDQGRDTITTSRHDSPDDDMATGHQANALRAMKQKVPLYRIQLTRPDGSKSFTLWSFVHVDGKFRFIGKTKQSQPPKATGKESVDSAVDMLGELPIRRAREIMKEQR
jgi:hypothetical protein